MEMTAAGGSLKLYLDTNVFIQAFETSGLSAEPAQRLLAALHANEGAAVTSELTLAELLAPVDRPNALPQANRRQLYLNLLVWNNFVDLLQITRDILIGTADLREAASLKNGTKIRLPDAIHIVTAVQARCRFFVTNDKGIARTLPRDLTPIPADSGRVAKLIATLHAP
jgi:predicted nucleic acid-binding protein